jgi:pimeloyl-ACP methyl ester carboxylesterase
MQDLGRPVYALDLRNHGHSPHASPMTYPALATDVVSFLREHRLADVQLLGHSMGGKVAMALALAEPDALQKLVVADIAPSVGSISPEFTEYVRAMGRVQARKLRTRKEAQQAMRETESVGYLPITSWNHIVDVSFAQDPAVLAFLMTNLVSADDGTVHFRLPLEILEESVGHIGDFPIAPGERSWDGPTLFVKGLKSK